MQLEDGIKEYFYFELGKDGMTIESSISKDFLLTLANLDIPKKDMAQLVKLKTALDLLLNEDVLFPEMTISKNLKAKPIK